MLRLRARLVVDKIWRHIPERCFDLSVEQETPDLIGIAVRHHDAPVCGGDAEVVVTEGFRFDRWDGSISWHAPGDQYLSFSEFVLFHRCVAACGDPVQCADACNPPPPAPQQSAAAD
jgi:hypothetical protein